MFQKYLRKFRGDQWTYIVHVYGFQHMVMFKILDKTLQNPFWIFQAFEIFTKEISLINPKNILACHIWHVWWSWQVSCHAEQYNPMKPSQNHFCPFSSLKNCTLSNLSKCSITWSTCYNGLISHLDQVAQVGEQVILIKVPQNPFWPDPNLNNSTLPTFYLWPQNLWTCSKPQIMKLHQVVHQGELFCMTRSW